MWPQKPLFHREKHPSGQKWAPWSTLKSYFSSRYLIPDLNQKKDSTVNGDATVFLGITTGIWYCGYLRNNLYCFVVYKWNKSVLGMINSWSEAGAFNQFQRPFVRTKQQGLFLLYNKLHCMKFTLVQRAIQALCPLKCYLNSWYSV